MAESSKILLSKKKKPKRGGGSVGKGSGTDLLSPVGIAALAQQVKNLLVVELEKGDLDLEVVVVELALFLLIKDVDQRSWDDAGVDVVLGVAGKLLDAFHGVRLARAGLSVGEDRAVVALQHLLDEGRGHRLEHVLLFGDVAKDFVEVEGLGHVGEGLLLHRHFPGRRAVDHTRRSGGSLITVQGSAIRRRAILFEKERKSPPSLLLKEIVIYLTRR